MSPYRYSPSTSTSFSQSEREKAKKTARKHVTTACDPCRESKIRCDGATPNCQNCRRKRKDCRYQGDDKRKLSLRVAAELFVARIDQLCQFIHDRGLEPPSMKPEDELSLRRILDALQIPRGSVREKDAVDGLGVGTDLSSSSVPVTEDGRFSGAMPYANSEDNQGTSQLQQQQPESISRQTQNDRNTEDGNSDSDSEETDEADNYVIEQISHRMGTLKLAGDGHLRFYGATSNLNLVDVSATQERQHRDARTLRQDGQDVLNSLGIGQMVDQQLEDHLVELYFTWQNPSAYVVDKEMYITARSKWRDEQVNTPFYSEVLTNAICAVGSSFEARYHPTFITFPKSLAEFFAVRAKALISTELDSPCVATVQAAVILSWHEGASNRDARGWLYSGLSMRIAFDLGLHVDMTPYVENGDLSPFEARVRQATFWGSYSADNFWGFYLGRPYRMNAGDITVPKPTSEKEAIWQPYGLDTRSDAFSQGLRSPDELISKQLAVLWGIVSPVSHILYGCTNISRHDLQRLTHKVTESLFSWKENLPSNLKIDLDDETTPKLPHLLMLHMQYHQIVISFHKPWVSKNYIQPRYPRQGPGYLHARRMCIESATAIAELLQQYEKHYTFNRMNNQVVAITFTAALILISVAVSNSPIPKTTARASSSNSSNSGVGGVCGCDNDDKIPIGHLNLCFRALDELGSKFENAKRTRDLLVTLQLRWQTHMRRSSAGSLETRRTGAVGTHHHQQQQPQPQRTKPARQYPDPGIENMSDRKRSKLGTPAWNPQDTCIPHAIPTSVFPDLSFVPPPPPVDSGADASASPEATLAHQQLPSSLPFPPPPPPAPQFVDDQPYYQYQHQHQDGHMDRRLQYPLLTHDDNGSGRGSSGELYCPPAGFGFPVPVPVPVPLPPGNGNGNPEDFGAGVSPQMMGFVDGDDRDVEPSSSASFFGGFESGFGFGGSDVDVEAWWQMQM